MSKSIEQRSMMSVGVVLAVLGGLALMSGPGSAVGQDSSSSTRSTTTR